MKWTLRTFTKWQKDIGFKILIYVNSAKKRIKVVHKVFYCDCALQRVWLAQYCTHISYIVWSNHILIRGIHVWQWHFIEWYQSWFPSQLRHCPHWPAALQINTQRQQGLTRGRKKKWHHMYSTVGGVVPGLLRCWHAFYLKVYFIFLWKIPICTTSQNPFTYLLIWFSDSLCDHFSLQLQLLIQWDMSFSALWVQMRFFALSICLESFPVLPENSSPHCLYSLLQFYCW